MVRGVLRHDAAARMLPSGQEVLSYDLVVRPPQGKAESVPVVWYDPERRAPRAAGTDVVVVGRIRQRFYRVNGLTQNRTELVAERVVPVTRRATVRTLMAKAIESLEPA